MRSKNAVTLLFVLPPILGVFMSCASIIDAKPGASFTASVCKPACTRICVQVIEDQGQPVMGAVVRFLTDEDNIYIVHATDINGYAIIDNPRESKNSYLIVTASGFQPFVSGPFSVATGQNITVITRIIVDPKQVVE